jgi:hypothetical protein
VARVTRLSISIVREALRVVNKVEKIAMWRNSYLIVYPSVHDLISAPKLLNTIFKILYGRLSIELVEEIPVLCHIEK